MANFKVKCFTREKFLEDLNVGQYPFVIYALDIIGSHEKNRINSKKPFEEFLSDTYTAFADSKNASAFVLFKDDTPISFVMFENVNFDDDALATTMIWTKKNYEGSGYARSLLNYALGHYANNTDCEKCYSTINDKNEMSLSMHNYFVRHGYAREFSQLGKIMCELDIKKFKDETEFKLLPTQNQELYDNEEEIVENLQ